MKIEIDLSEKFKKEIREILREEIKELLKSKFLPNQESKEEDLLNINQACSFLGCTKTTLYNYRKKGSLPYLQRGRKIFFKKSDLLYQVQLNESSRNGSARPLTRLNQCKKCTRLQADKQGTNLKNSVL